LLSIEIYSLILDFPSFLILLNTSFVASSKTIASSSALKTEFSISSGVNPLSSGTTTTSEKKHATKARTHSYLFFEIIPIFFLLKPR
jgi:hypothetical protein